MTFDAPFKLGPFLIDAQGRLSLKDPAARPAFVFRWHRRLIRAWLDQGRLVLQMTLGRVRSSASAKDETLRPRSFALLHWLQRIAPPNWRLALLPDHRVWLETSTAIELPVTAACLVTAITCFALELSPYLDLLDEIGLTPSDLQRSIV